MTRTTLSPCTATVPIAMPVRRWRQVAGKATIAATSTRVASTPLQPASIDTANAPFAALMTLPLVRTPGSNVWISAVATRATASVQGATTAACAHGVNSSPKSTASSRTKVTKNRGMESRAGERRALREIALDAVGDRFCEALLLGGIAQLELFVRVGNERGFHEYRRNVRSLQHREPGLLDDGLVERVVGAEFLQHVPSHFHAVVDLR